jgi:peptide deformylase
VWEETREVILTDEKLLRVECIDVLQEEVSELVLLLEKELEYSAKLGSPGVGLAAPQIGINKKISIVRFDQYKIDLINCEIVNQFDEIVFENEGCLSFPGKLYTTKRPQEIHVKSSLCSFIARGYLAAVISHELDHLNGILITDRKR